MRAPRLLLALLLTGTALLAAPAARADAQALDIAHRGASSRAPENTLVSIRAGIRDGGQLAEIDVRRSKDGRLVLLHDAGLARTTDVEQVFPGRAPWNVGDFTYAELQQLDAGSWMSDRYAGKRIPTLDQVLQLLAERRQGLLLEIKEPQLYPGVEAEVAATLHDFPGWFAWGVRSRRLLVHSFDYDSMRLFSTLEPAVRIGLLGRPARTRLAGLSSWADVIGVPHTRARRSYVAAVHQQGMDVFLWTVDAAADMKRALHIGGDGVITNRPAVLARVIRNAG
ncbi:glycerophosphodiester phosphodiesterase [Nocardioides mesophilus]|uniref:Glycerophosphodiester phosphodiesterase n=1 Tax=Nocardioides mesophilus TaxID=433659 RepID=A0A7G9R9W6_9ACTN|nr:glycerophosphodiester phosphodiesterase family protein [Nocardioides mesophilus]QNN52391.1 glycerophosphodiester phosphodiesterase [Nocardioides mesophilus]